MSILSIEWSTYETTNALFSFGYALGSTLPTLNDASGKEVLTSTIFKVEDLERGGTGSYTISGTGVPANTKTLTAHVSVSKVTFSY